MPLFSKLVAGLALAAALAGCSTNQSDQVLDPNGYLDRRDAISLTAGDAIASNIATQMVDPWPAYAGDRNIPYNGQRAQAAVERYRYNKVTPPRGTSASATYAPQTPDNSSNANAAPLGPTINQTPAVK
jgi:hypothetical protein